MMTRAEYEARNHARKVAEQKAINDGLSDLVAAQLGIRAYMAPVSPEVEREAQSTTSRGLLRAGWRVA